MKLRVVAGLITIALIAAACSGGEADEDLSDLEDSTPVVQLPATIDDSDEAEQSDDPLIPTTTLVVFPRTADYELLFLAVGDEYDPDIGVLGNRPEQVDFIANMFAAQVHNDWDAVYAMATQENQALCPRDEFDAITAGLEKRDEIPIIFNNISVTQSSDTVYGSFDILVPADELDDLGFRIAGVPELVTSRDTESQTVQEGLVGGLVSVTGSFLPYELFDMEAYDIDRLAFTQANGPLAKIQDGDLMMAENPCVIAAKTAEGVNAATYWTYPELIEEEPVAADTTTTTVAAQ